MKDKIIISIILTLIGVSIIICNVYRHDNKEKNDIHAILRRYTEADNDDNPAKVAELFGERIERYYDAKNITHNQLMGLYGKNSFGLKYHKLELEIEESEYKYDKINKQHILNIRSKYMFKMANETDLKTYRQNMRFVFDSKLKIIKLYQVKDE